MRITLANIRVRLIAWYIVSLGCVHLILAASLFQIVSGRLYHELDQRLETYATCLVELLPQHKHLELAEVIEEMAELTALGPDLYVHVADHSGQIVYESSSLAPTVIRELRKVIDVAQASPRTIRVLDSGPWRLLTRHVEEQGQLAYVGHVAIPLRGVQQALARLWLILIGVIPCSMFLASFGAWFLLNRALHPLQDVIHTAQIIQAKNLDQRLRVPRSGDEVQVLAETFNEMVGRLQRSFEQMRQFISDASHELRTPLAVLKGEVELGLKNHQPRTDHCQEILETCASEIGRISRLVETLLFLSSTDADKIALELKPIPISRMMEEMAEEARILAEAKQIRVEYVNGDTTVLRADEMRLKQLFLNLIDNAVKYTPKGGQMRLGCRSEDDHVELSVADTGIGIAARHLPRIFDRFYRVDPSRNRVNGGYGLGLAICKWITEAHHGTIHVESAPGKGSTFRVRLPLVA